MNQSFFLHFNLLIALATTTLTPAIADDPIVFVVPHGDSFVWTENDTKAMSDETSIFESVDAAGIGFDISYADVDVGFADPETGSLARDTFRQVLEYVAAALDFNNKTVEIFVRPSQTDGQGFLAASGTGFPSRPGIHPGGMLHRLISGEKLSEDVPEMVITVDFGYPWAFADESPDPEKFDLFPTLLHEVVHALGFSSRLSNTGISVGATDSFSVYDTFLVDRTNGRKLISRNLFLPYFTSNADSLISNAIGFAGPHAVKSFGQGLPVPVFSADPFRQGSSLSHWEFDILPGGVLMDPASGAGEFMREFSAVDYGAIQDLVEEAKATERSELVGCAPSTANPASYWVPLSDGLVMIIISLGLIAASPRSLNP